MYNLIKFYNKYIVNLWDETAPNGMKCNIKHIENQLWNWHYKQFLML